MSPTTTKPGATAVEDDVEDDAPTDFTVFSVQDVAEGEDRERIEEAIPDAVDDGRQDEEEGSVLEEITDLEEEGRGFPRIAFLVEEEDTGDKDKVILGPEDDEVDTTTTDDDDDNVGAASAGDFI